MTARSVPCSVLIAGAGLSGLATALLLQEAGASVHVLEANDRPGGRIRSVRNPASGRYVADLGPTWVWPEFQPVVQRWVERLNLRLFEQYAAGDAIADRGPRQAPQRGFLPGQIGSMRPEGGIQAFIDALMDRLHPGTVQLRCPITAVRAADGGVVLTSSTGQTHQAQIAVIGVPPRVVAETITLDIGAPPSLIDTMAGVPTWMAPHAKAVVVFEAPFWRGMGLSGRIASQAGPLVEVHDHCGPGGSPAALFGFVGWSHAARQQAADDLQRHVLEQMQRCFGTDLPSPIGIHIEDWATEALTSTQRDLVSSTPHPDLAPEVLRTVHGGGRIWFAGAETSVISPGLIEGALDAAERVAGQIVASWSPGADGSRGGRLATL